MKYLSSFTSYWSGDCTTADGFDELDSPRPEPILASGLQDDDPDERCFGTTMTEKARCSPYLEGWAGASELILASFYFWNSGEEIQTTQHGLYRTLLYQIFSVRPQLIPIAAPRDWESACLFGCCQTTRTLQELHDQLVCAVQGLKETAKICCFIDGLDEFGDNHEDLISMVKELIGCNTHVKVCVASRPWTIFQTAFDQKPSLQLEDLTHSDIVKFVRSQLHADVEFDNARRRYPAFADQLIENIVSKASGVFLWVDLVVKSLLAGMRLGDRIQDLQRRLDALPDDLERLYDKILHSLDPFYLDHAAQYFALIEQAEEPLTILQLSFADEDTAESVINMALQGLTDEQASLRAEAMSKRLNNRCKGLLEVDRGLRKNGARETSKRHQLTVQYLHRTVRDCIKSQKASDFLAKSRDPNFDAAAQLCVAYIMDIKVSKDREPHPPTLDNLLRDFDVREPFFPLCKCVARCLRQAAKSKIVNQHMITGLLVDLREVLRKPRYREALSKDFRDYFSRVTATHPWEHVIRDEHPPALLYSSILQDNGSSMEDSFLALATALGIVDYVRTMAPRHGLISRRRNGLRYEGLPFAYPLLGIALSAAAPDPGMVQCLLDLGADPNFRSGASELQIPQAMLTPWIFALCSLSETLKASTGLGSGSAEVAKAEKQWKETLRLLYRHGGYLGRVPDGILTPVSRRILTEIQTEVDPTLPRWRSMTWPWFGGR